MTALDRARAVLWRHREVSGRFYAEEPQTELEDMLADLRTYVWTMGLDWVKAVDMAEIHFEEEQEI